MTPEQILSRVKRLLPSHFDHENIAMNLWLGAWQRTDRSQVDVPISQKVIYARCVDEIRHQHVVEKSIRFALQTLDDLKPSLDVGRIIELAGLTHAQRQSIVFRFYCGLSLEECALTSGIGLTGFTDLLNSALSRLRVTARILGDNDDP